MASPETEEVRIDKWLWAVRLYKTREAAAKACKAGVITVDGQRVKAARLVHEGQTVSVDDPHLIQRFGTTRVYVIKKAARNRVGAKLVSELAEDLSLPPPAPRENQYFGAPKRIRGEGRPTKRDRRQFERFAEELPVGYELDDE